MLASSLIPIQLPLLDVLLLWLSTMMARELRVSSIQPDPWLHSTSEYFSEGKSLMMSFSMLFIVAGSALFMSVLYSFHVVMPFLLSLKMEGFSSASRYTTTWQSSGMSFAPICISFRSL